MNRRGFEIISPFSAPVHRWRIILILNSLLIMTELVMACFICRSGPDVMSHLRNHGWGRQRIAVSFFVISFSNNLICSVVFFFARHRSAWKNRGVLIKCVVIWLAFQLLSFLISAIVHYMTYINIETTFEYTDFLPVLNEYSTDWLARLSIIRMHRQFRCCGITAAYDFIGIRWYFEEMELDSFKYKVPKSCCRITKCVFGAQIYENLTVFQHGCYNYVMDEIESVYRVKFILFAILSVFHALLFLIIVCSMPNIEKVNMSYEEFVMNKNLFTVLYQKGLMQKIEKKFEELKTIAHRLEPEEMDRRTKQLEDAINKELFSADDDDLNGDDDVRDAGEEREKVEKEDGVKRKRVDDKSERMKKEEEFHKSLSVGSTESLQLFDKHFPEKSEEKNAENKKPKMNRKFNKKLIV
ncbi:hypothetical protein HELRODRAFT_182054 [Helobdella robusta]|uniref:Tetraspanin n=1 Tax=Helobdella robusta TaxID=6412 RepID=T1FHN8_HELRO|nr:hypothetical protein HELRODRAFT_182054 [Helobdella robusta]ESN91876.1 hypothetical protein HELRODRAFT_182054 [Helobdella robusta]